MRTDDAIDETTYKFAAMIKLFEENSLEFNSNDSSQYYTRRQGNITLSTPKMLKIRENSTIDHST
uniref:Uncharacterized protein n=1 Tax=Romanomermis culicivorax TaxID=13658 RepID=A0A915HIE9_ROMCU